MLKVKKLLQKLVDAFTVKDTVLPVGTYFGNDCPVRKRAGVVSIYLFGIKNIPRNQATVIGQLPSGFAPAMNIAQDVRTPEGYAVRIIIDINGQITAYNYSTNTGLLNAHNTITYVGGGTA